jgi:hypothetical protein
MIWLPGKGVSEAAAGDFSMMACGTCRGFYKKGRISGNPGTAQHEISFGNYLEATALVGEAKEWPLFRASNGRTERLGKGLVSSERRLAVPPVIGQSSDKNQAAVLGQAAAGGDAVFGDGGVSGRGVVGVSQSHTGVEGGVTDPNAATGIAVFGNGGDSGRGVVGLSNKNTAVEGDSQTGVGVFGSSNTGEGVHGVSHSQGAAAVIGINDNTGPGVRGVSTGFTV